MSGIPGRTSLILSAALLAAAGPTPLAAEHHRARPVVLVAPSASDPAAVALAQALARPEIRDAFAERQVVVFTVLAGHGAREGRPIGADETAALLTGLGLPPDGPATMLLIGKDGGVKLRRHDFSAADVIAVIDTMPMRRAEMRR